jgi:hypothetical protein
VFILMKNVKSRIRKHLTDEQLEGCMQTTEIKPDIERYSSKSGVRYLSNDSPRLRKVLSNI